MVVRPLPQESHSINPRSKPKSLSANDEKFWLSSKPAVRQHRFASYHTVRIAPSGRDSFPHRNLGKSADDRVAQQSSG